MKNNILIYNHRIDLTEGFFLCAFNFYLNIFISYILPLRWFSANSKKPPMKQYMLQTICILLIPREGTIIKLKAQQIKEKLSVSAIIAVFPFSYYWTYF